MVTLWPAHAQAHVYTRAYTHTCRHTCTHRDIRILQYCVLLKARTIKTFISLSSMLPYKGPQANSGTRLKKKERKRIIHESKQIG